MTAQFILIIIYYVNTGLSGGDHVGTAVSFQEFNSKNKCEYVAALIKTKGTIKEAICVDK